MLSTSHISGGPDSSGASITCRKPLISSRIVPMSLTFRDSCAFPTNVHALILEGAESWKDSDGLKVCIQPCYGNPYGGERPLPLMALKALRDPALII